MLLKAVQLSYPYLFQILMIVKRPLTDNVTGKLHTTVGGMLRAALGTTSLSAVKNLIGITNLSSCSSPPTGIYRLLCPVIFI